MEKERTPQYEIREATFEDVEAVRRMHAQSWLDTYPNEEHDISYDWVKETTDAWLTPGALEKSREYFNNIFGNPEHFYRIALDGDRVIGLMHVDNKDGHKHLGALYIDQDYHGTGLAQKMMKLADDWIGDEDVSLEVVTYNKRAIRFYEKHGYQLTDTENELFAGKIPNVTMVRKGQKR